MESMKAYEEFVENTKKIKENHQKIEKFTKKIEIMLFKYSDIDTVSKEITQMIELFFNTKNQNRQMEDQFLILFRKLLMKFKRTELMNTFFIINNLVNDILFEVNSYSDDNDFVDSLDVTEIKIKPNINLEKDYIKIKFNLNDYKEIKYICIEILEKFGWKYKEFDKDQLDLENLLKLLEIRDDKLSNNVIDESLQTDDSKILIFINRMDEENIMNMKRIVKDKMKFLKLKKNEKKEVFNKIVSKIISKKQIDSTLNDYFIFEHNQVLNELKCISKSKALVNKSPENVNEFLKSEFGIDKIDEDLRLFSNIKKDCFIFLENQIMTHLKLCRRNTKNLKKTFDNFINMIESMRKEHPFLKDVLSILPFGSYTQFSYNKKSDLEISLISKFLPEFINLDEHRKDFKTQSKKNLNNENSTEHTNSNDTINQKFYNLQKERNTFFENLEGVIFHSGKYFKIYSHNTKRVRIIEFYDKETLVKIELILDNILPLYNSHLIRTYCLYDSRVIIMINFIKDWSKLMKINGNFDNNLSSYCFSLMVIFFLQKIQPKILPVLQEKDLKKFKNIFFYDNMKNKDNKDFVNVRHIFNSFDEVYPRKYYHQNNMSVAELLFNFFKFYLYNFDQKTYCIDIQKEEYLFRFSKLSNKYEDGKEYIIIDPFDFNYNPASYLEERSQNSIILKKVFYESLIKILKSEKIIDY